MLQSGVLGNKDERQTGPGHVGAFDQGEHLGFHANAVGRKPLERSEQGSGRIWWTVVKDTMKTGWLRERAEEGIPGGKLLLSLPSLGGMMACWGGPGGSESRQMWALFWRYSQQDLLTDLKWDCERNLETEDDFQVYGTSRYIKWCHFPRVGTHLVGRVRAVKSTFVFCTSCVSTYQTAEADPSTTTQYPFSLY